MSRHGLAMLGSLLAVALGGCGSGPTQQPKAKSTMPEFTVVPHAAGATRLLLSPNGRHAVAELRGRWIRDEYGDHAADVPGLLKLLDNTGAIAKTMMGWPLGGPTDSGNFQYLTEGHEEGKLEVRTTASSNAAVPLVPPGDGFWTMETTVAASSGPCNVVVMSQPLKGYDYRNPNTRRTRLWIAAIDRETGATQAQRSFVATLPTLGKIGHGVGVAAGSQHIAFVEVPESRADDDEGWHVTALRCSDLAEAWRITLPDLALGASPNSLPTSPTPPTPPTPLTPLTANGAEQPRPTVARASLAPAQSRVTGSATLVFAGDKNNSRLVVIRGIAGQVAVDLERVFVISPSDGSVLHDVVVRDRSPVAELVPGPHARVSMLFFERVRQGGGSSRQPVFFGLRELDATTGQLGELIAPKHAAGVDSAGMASLLPRTHARSAARFILAPGSYAWVANHIQGDVTWPSGRGTGANAPEVARWVSIPAGWHRASSRTTQRRAAWLEAQRQP